MMRNVSVSRITALIKEKLLFGLSLVRGKNLRKRTGGSLAACVVPALFRSLCAGNVRSVVLVLVEICTIFHSVKGGIFRAL